MSSVSGNAGRLACRLACSTPLSERPVTDRLAACASGPFAAGHLGELTQQIPPHAPPSRPRGPTHVRTRTPRHLAGIQGRSDGTPTRERVRRAESLRIHEPTPSQPKLPRAAQSAEHGSLTSSPTSVPWTATSSAASHRDPASAGRWVLPFTQAATAHLLLASNAVRAASCCVSRDGDCHCFFSEPALGQLG